MHNPARAKWVCLGVALLLLAGTFLPASPIFAASQSGNQSNTAKKNSTAASHLQKQRQRLQKQRERLQKQRQRFKKQQERQRQKLKELKEKKDEEDETDVWDGFFPWKTDGSFSDNLPTGLGLAGLGIAGALILIFGFLGSYLPSMGGKAEYEALQLEIAALTKRRDKQLEAREKYARNEGDFDPEQRQEASRLTQDLGEIVQSKEAEARQKYRQVLSWGIPIYIVIGGVLAVLLATNALQALLIGFAWTSIADRLGLKRELTEKKTTKDEGTEELEKDAKEGVKAKAALTEKDALIAKLTKAVSDATQTAARIKAEG